VIDAQPPWSDFPILVLARKDQDISRRLISREMLKALGNVTLLERPFHPAAFVSLATTSIRSRRRQYEARSNLEELAQGHDRLERTLVELDAERASLREMARELEHRVDERTAALRDEVIARERAQEQLLQAQKMESLGQLTGGVAHDFNNLLTAIMANLEVMTQHVEPDSVAAGLVRSAMTGAERGASLTQRMLAFARQQEFATSSAHVHELVRNTRELIQRTIGPQITLDDGGVRADLPLVRVDPVQFELAMLNLAINARDAMPGGGRIELTAGHVELPASPTVRAGSYVWVAVRDTGTGMTPETLQRATEPFFSTKPVGKGTGLGLSMIRGFIEQLGGTIEIRSEVGKGTEVRMWLPLAEDESALAPAAITESPAVDRATILLVDDDALIASSTRLLLEAIGHRVVDAVSAERAIEVIENGSEIDLVMTDYAMPGMSGLELATYVRRFRPDLPVLLVTGFADLPGGSAPNIPLLSKPYRQSQLEEQLAALLTTHGKR
jgi:signal transduction histidine kinase